MDKKLGFRLDSEAPGITKIIRPGFRFVALAYSPLADRVTAQLQSLLNSLPPLTGKDVTTPYQQTPIETHSYVFTNAQQKGVFSQLDPFLLQGRTTLILPYLPSSETVQADIDLRGRIQKLVNDKSPIEGPPQRNQRLEILTIGLPIGIAANFEHIVNISGANILAPGIRKILGDEIVNTRVLYQPSTKHSDIAENLSEQLGIDPTIYVDSSTSHLLEDGLANKTVILPIRTVHKYTVPIIEQLCTLLQNAGAKQIILAAIHTKSGVSLLHLAENPLITHIVTSDTIATTTDRINHSKVTICPVDETIAHEIIQLQLPPRRLPLE